MIICQYINTSLLESTMTLLYKKAFPPRGVQLVQKLPFERLTIQLLNKIKPQKKFVKIYFENILPKS